VVSFFGRDFVMLRARNEDEWTEWAKSLELTELEDGGKEITDVE
jgi:hypothetical protein